MDETDLAILDHLEADHRTPLASIAQHVGIARSTARRRLDSLYRLREFEGYRIEVDRLALGLERLVYLEVKTNPREAWLLQAIESLDQCVESDGVIGEYGLIFKMLFRDGGELAKRLRVLDPLIASSSAKRYRIVDVIESYKERGLPTRDQSPVVLDRFDRVLLRLLLDQRSSSPTQLWKLARDLGTDLGRTVSKSAVQKRVRALERKGVIRQFTITPRWWNRHRGFRAFIRMKTDPGLTRRIATDSVSRMQEVVCLYRTGEDYGLFAEVFVGGLGSLNELLKRVYGIDGVTDTVTTIVLERRRERPIPAAPLL
jgi:DNA-binding Lrp family transcriptional regulator